MIRWTSSKSRSIGPQTTKQRKPTDKPLWVYPGGFFYSRNSNAEKRPWGLNTSLQAHNKDDLLCVDFGMQEWNEFDSQEIVRKYRAFVYETGAAVYRGQRSEVRGQGEKAIKGIDQNIVKKERRRKYKVSRVDRFRYRCRYFNDAGIIGSKAFVGEVFDQVKHLLSSKDQRTFTPVSGVANVYSMKRLGSLDLVSLLPNTSYPGTISQSECKNLLIS